MFVYFLYNYLLLHSQHSPVPPPVLIGFEELCGNHGQKGHYLFMLVNTLVGVGGSDSLSTWPYLLPLSLSEL